MKILKWLGVLALIGGLAVAGVVAWGWSEARGFLAETPSSEHAERIVSIERGSGPQRIARTLAEAGVVTDAERFGWYLRWQEAAPRLRAGEFRFFTDQTPEQVLQVLLEGKEVTRPITLPPGLRYTEMALLAEQAGLGTAEEYVGLAEDADFIASLGLSFEPSNLEGVLMPETYSFPRRAGIRELVEAQVQRFQTIWDERRSAQAEAIGMTPYEVVTLASVVEKETGRASERPVIAGVFHRRLSIGMPLQSDPTIIYGLENYDGNIRRADIRRPHPWNTYVIPALPPTPIAGAGVEAIDAVLWPQDTRALYFVARGDGSHHFSETLAEHNRMVDCFQRGRRSACP